MFHWQIFLNSLLTKLEHNKKVDKEYEEKNTKGENVLENREKLKNPRAKSKLLAIK